MLHGKFTGKNVLRKLDEYAPLGANVAFGKYKASTVSGRLLENEMSTFQQPFCKQLVSKLAFSTVRPLAPTWNSELEAESQLVAPYDEYVPSSHL